MPNTTLSVNRKADRETMATMLSAIGERHGATVTQSSYHERENTIRVELGGVSVSVQLDGRHRRTGFLGHWNSERRFDRSFAADIRGSVNAYHGCKATSWADDFEDILGSVDRGLECVSNGMAFEEDN